MIILLFIAYPDVSVILIGDMTILLVIFFAELTGSGFDLARFISLSSGHFCTFDVHGAIYIFKNIFVTFFIYILVPDGIGHWPGSLTVVLDCYNIIGLVR